MQLLIQIAIISIFFIVFYFLLIRPQTRRQKERRQLIEGLVKGDEIVTVGGIIGTIREIDEETMDIETGDITLKLSRTAVGSKVEKQ